VQAWEDEDTVEGKDFHLIPDHMDKPELPFPSVWNTENTPDKAYAANLKAFGDMARKTRAAQHDERDAPATATAASTMPNATVAPDINAWSACK
jgi:hypothetical protein